MKTKIIYILLIDFILIIKVNSQKYQYLPLNITFDYSNFILNDSILRQKIISEFELIKNVFKSLFEVRENVVTEKSLGKPLISGIYFNTRNISKYLYKKSSIFIFIKSKNITENNSLFAYEAEKEIITSRPLLSVITVNNNTEFLSKNFKNENDINFVKWNIIRVLLNIVGMYEKLDNKIDVFVLIHILDYIGKHYNSYYSFQKFLNLTDNYLTKNKYRKPNKKLNMVIQRLPNIRFLNDIMKDDFNKNISDLSTITEITINSFNDFSNYKIKKCDLKFIANQCFRFDKKCIKNIQKYFMEYSIKDDKVICYLNTKKNILSKKCGIHYGNLISQNILEKKISYNYLLHNLTNVSLINTVLEYNNIPDLELYDNQKIYLLKQSPRCPKKHPRTIFFIDPDLNEHNSKIKNETIDTIILNDTKFFVVYGRSPTFFPQKNILNANNFIQSTQTWNNFNIFLCRQSLENFYIKNIENNPLNPYQVFSCFKNSTINKADLYRIYIKMQNKFSKEDFNYMPETIIYPENKDLIINKFKNYDIENISEKELKNNLWLHKPIGSSHGLGIDFIKNFDDIKTKASNKNFIITKYISNPLLINKKKFDIKTYLLVTGVNPLKLYFFTEGYVDFATNIFSINKTTLSNGYIHLANSAKNMRNQGRYKRPSNINDEKGTEWRLGLFEKYCNKNNINFTIIIEQIKDIMIKNFIPIAEKIVKNNEFYNDNDFQIIEFDFIIDEKLKIFLMEIDTDPEFVYEHMVKLYVINHLLIDAWNIVGIVPYAHDETNELFDKDVYVYDNKLEEKIDKALCEFERPLGLFERLFPLKNNIEKYKKYFENITQENKMLWEKIE